VRQIVGMYAMGASMAAPYVGAYIMFTPDEMNNLVLVGAQVARWYDWPEVMNERAQDHMALFMLVGVIARGHYQQFQEMQARKRPAPNPAPSEQVASPDVAEWMADAPDVQLPTPDQVAAMERERLAHAAD
jgi:hypothetical protein